jgi:ubiquinone biosynthesis protein
MGWGPISAVRDIARLHEITSVFIRHGLGDLMRRAGVAGMLERAGQILRWGEASEARNLTPHQRLRSALEELGPTFVKLGQMLSTREDLLSPAWTEELERLQSRVAPVPFDALLPQVEKALGRSPFDVFVDLERESYASASIAQVHRARLPNGTPVVLKIRRPGIVPKMEADLRILAQVADLIEIESAELRRYRPSRIVAEFRRSVERELDLAVEARNVERFARNFADDPNILIPRVYWEWTSNIMNVQEHMEGIPGTDMAAIDAAALDRKVLAARGMDAVLKMILVDGFFQADPHPGNVFYLPGNRLVMIDFGMAGRISTTRRRQLIDLLTGIARQDEDAMLEVLREWTSEEVEDEERLASDFGELAFDYADTPLKELRIGPLLHRVSAVMREHSIVLPSDLTLMFKALITLEGVGRQYDPDIRLVERIKPFIDRVATERYQPRAIAERGQAAVAQFFNLVTSLPRDLARLVADARRGRLRVDLDLRRLDSFGRQLDRTLDRTTMGILTASLVIGSSIILTVQGGPQIFGVPILTVLGLAGYVLAFFNSLWIIYGIWRSGKR